MPEWHATTAARILDIDQAGIVDTGITACRGSPAVMASGAVVY
jgi:Ethanolamine utilization protein EutJ (predicted chaperonin)